MLCYWTFFFLMWACSHGTIATHFFMTAYGLCRGWWCCCSRITWALALNSVRPISCDKKNRSRNRTMWTCLYENYHESTFLFYRETIKQITKLLVNVHALDHASSLSKSWQWKLQRVLPTLIYKMHWRIISCDLKKRFLGQLRKEGFHLDLVTQTGQFWKKMFLTTQWIKKTDFSLGWTYSWRHSEFKKKRYTWLK